MRESKIEKYLRAEIAKLGGVAEKKVVPGVRGPPDQEVAWTAGSDQSIELTGSGWAPAVEFIETKTKGGKLSALQKRDHARRAKMGFEVWVIWDMAGAEYYLKQRGKK